jgi:hypothetical protein
MTLNHCLTLLNAVVLWGTPRGTEEGASTPNDAS